MSKKNLIAQFCLGEVPQSGEIAAFDSAEHSYRNSRIICPYYLEPEKECNLLKASLIEEFLKKCRYDPISMIYTHAEECTEDLLHRGDVENIDFEKILENLKTVKLTEAPTLTVWNKYVKEAVYNEVRKKISERRIITSRKTCKYCQHLVLKSSSYFCVKKDIPKKTRDKACQDGFKFITPVGELEDIERATNTIFHSEPYQNFRIVKIKKCLRQRFEDEKRKSKKREKYQRQYEIFSKMTRILNDETLKKEQAKARLAKAYHVNKKTIERDLDEVFQYLKDMNFFKNVARDSLTIKEGGMINDK